MVGAARFELTASCTRNKRATKLRHAPTSLLLPYVSATKLIIRHFTLIVNTFVKFFLKFLKYFLIVPWKTFSLGLQHEYCQLQKLQQLLAIILFQY